MKIRTFLAACALAVGVCAGGVAAAEGYDPQNADQNDFILGNLTFLAYHEAGHLILDQLVEADQRAQRMASEQAADDIATLMMLPDEGHPEDADDIIAAVVGWELSAESSGFQAPSQHYPSDSQRESRIVCLLYASNPKEFADFRKRVAAEWGEKACAGELKGLEKDFKEMFGDSLVPPAPSTRANISVVYERAADASLQTSVQFLRKNRVLEDLADDIGEFVSLPEPITLRAKSCGPGAAEYRYDDARREIIACYEATQWFMDHIPPELGGAIAREHNEAVSSAADSDDLGSGGSRVKKRPRN